MLEDAPWKMPLTDRSGGQTYPAVLNSHEVKDCYKTDDDYGNCLKSTKIQIPKRINKSLLNEALH